MRQHKSALSAVLLLTSIGNAWTQTPDKLNGDELMATIRTLSSPEFEGRRVGTPGGLKARMWIADRFAAIGLDPLITDAGNVVAVCQTSSAAHQAMVISSHYDHLGIRNGAMFPGADDDASGVAVMLAIAARCHLRPLAHDALFVAFDSEESGLKGSKAFLANPPIAKERIALDVNLDMVSRSAKRELYVAGPYHWPETRPLLQQVAKRSAINLLFGHDKPKELSGGQDDWTKQSDHSVFHAAGIPFVYFGVEDHEDYHKPTDTADKIDATFLEQAAETILDAVITLDSALPFSRK